MCDFNSEEVAGYDRKFRLQHAWAIFNSYLSPTARFNIGIPLNISEDAHKLLQRQQSTPFTPIDIDSNIFKPVMEQIVPHLQKTWLQFVKDDVSKFTESKLDLLRKEILAELGHEEYKDDQKEADKKIPEPEIAIENIQIYLKRPWIQEYLFKRAKTPPKNIIRKQLTEEEKLARDERRRQMEIERRKALRRALRRAKMNRLNALDEDEENVSFRTSFITHIKFDSGSPLIY